jgi:hypothetical protein
MPEASDRKHFIHGWRLPLVASGLFAVFEWTHLVLNRTADKATLRGWGALGLLDGFLHTVDIPLKLLTLFFVPVALARALAHCHRDARATRFVAGVWLVSGLVLLGVLSAARDPLARLMNNDTAKFYPTSVTVNAEWRFGGTRHRRGNRRARGARVLPGRQEEALCVPRGPLAAGHPRSWRRARARPDRLRFR